MSGVLDLRGKSEVWRAGKSLSEVWAGGARVWQRPVTMASLVAGGVLPIWLRASQYAGGVLPNAGSAGTYFAASAPTWVALSGPWLQLGGQANTCLTLSNRADLVGVRFFMALSMTSIPATFAMVGHPGGSTAVDPSTDIYSASTGTVLQTARNNGAWSTYNLPGIGLTAGVHLVEGEYDGTNVRCWIDGALKGQASGPPSPLFATYIGGNRTKSLLYTGGLGDVCSLLSSAATPANVNAIRAHYNATFGTSAVLA